jgi:hypothetical protein
LVEVVLEDEVGATDAATVRVVVRLAAVEVGGGAEPCKSALVAGESGLVGEVMVLSFVVDWFARGSGFFSDSAPRRNVAFTRRQGNARSFARRVWDAAVLPDKGRTKPAQICPT